MFLTLVSEPMLLALGGGAIGLLLAVVAVRLVAAANPAGLPRLAEVQVDAQVLAFCFLAPVVTGLGR